MAADLDDLVATVQANTGVEASTVLLVQGVAAKIVAVKTDPAALAALSSQLRSSSASLADAVTAYTPVGKAAPNRPTKQEKDRGV